MPRDSFKPLTAQEQRFVIHFLREGAAEENLHNAARKARITEKEGKAILRRKHVQEEIHRRKVLVEFEENRLIARDNIGAAKQVDEAELVTLHKVEKALDGVLKLEAEKHGSTVLKAVELALIYTGTIRDGNKVKLQTVDPLGQDKSKSDEGEQAPREVGFYSSIFADMKKDGNDGGAAPAAAVAAAPLMPDEVEAAKPAPKPPVPAPAKPAKAPAPSKKPGPEIEIT